MKHSYAMLTYRPKDLLPRKFLMYDAFPDNTAIQKNLGERGMPPVMAFSHKKLLTSDDKHQVLSCTYATPEELESLVKIHVKPSKEGFYMLMKDVLKACKALKTINAGDIYFTMWTFENATSKSI